MTEVALVFRQAEQADLDRAVEIHSSAYPDNRSAAVRRRKFIENVFGDLGDFWIAALGGDVVAHGFLFRLEVWCERALVPFGGIASVGVAPEARGRGVGTRLVEFLQEQSRSRGDAATMLYPFRQRFYERLGYAPTSGWKRIIATPRAFPKSWRDAASGSRLRAATGDDQSAIIQVYERVAAKNNGLIRRTPRHWESRLLSESRRWFVVPNTTLPEALDGYVSFSLSQSEAHAKTSLTVHELIADTDEAMRILHGLLGLQRDQVHEVIIDVDSANTLEYALIDIDERGFGTEAVEHTIGLFANGPMIRLHDPKTALERRRYCTDGKLLLKVDGRALQFTAKNGRASVSAAPSAASADVDISLSAQTLAAIAFGGLLPSQASMLGNAIGKTQESLQMADAIFRTPPFFALDPF